jgi:hypothetical protein
MSGPVAEVTRLIKFDGDDEKWAEWNVKALAFAKSKDFKDAFLGNTAVIFTNATCNNATTHFPADAKLAMS